VFEHPVTAFNGASKWFFIVLFNMIIQKLFAFESPVTAFKEA
jgi:hypothetical protein